MPPGGLLAVYCLLIVAASVLGGWIPFAIRLTHPRLELLVSFVSGVMLGAALLELLPHAWEARLAGTPGMIHEWVDPVAAWVLCGFLAMFFVERFFSFHHHDAPEPGATGSTVHDHRHRLTWAGAAVGLSIHSLIEGIALAAAVASTGGGAGPAGFGVFLAIALHKPLDSLTLGSLMAVGRHPAPARHLVNAAFGLVVPAGVAVSLLGARLGAPDGEALIGSALAFSAGTFLCISLSDLLPELQFHRHDRLKLSAVLLLGIAVAWAAGRL